VESKHIQQVFLFQNLRKSHHTSALGHYLCVVLFLARFREKYLSPDECEQLRWKDMRSVLIDSGLVGRNFW
jgi:hypothetical protein